ncbi:MAG TPA: hypothetical protein VJN63_10465 [Thermoplasmata archaeon]|nr:hypothetical protein [Thermoplasmata archaeon]
MSSRMFVLVPSVAKRAGAVLAAGLLLLLALALPLRAVSGSSQDGLEDGFSHFLRTSGIEPSTLDESEASRLFQAFISNQPSYARLLQERMQTVVPGRGQTHDVAFVGPTSGTFTTAINGQKYIVELREGRLSDGSEFLKVTFIGPDGINDPWYYITRSYVYVRLCFPICWYVRAGEDYWLYADFETNAGGVNEAAIFRAKFNEWAIYSTALSAAVGLIAGILTGGWGGIAGAVSAFQANWANYVIGTAYDSQSGLSVAIFHRWLYAGLGYFALWAFWYIDYQWHRALPAPWLDLFSLTTNGILSSVLANIGNTYGWNRWLWGGVYRG